MALFFSDIWPAPAHRQEHWVVSAPRGLRFADGRFRSWPTPFIFWSACGWSLRGKKSLLRPARCNASPRHRLKTGSSGRARVTFFTTDEKEFVASFLVHFFLSHPSFLRRSVSARQCHTLFFLSSMPRRLAKKLAHIKQPLSFFLFIKDQTC
ncbi:hypothetical protein TW95_gp1714 [Pandoravirus inopinatum]|uniref:Uncharacterized protein n=1 Tax=Pandoravirus inopinatum TaxID=1605721 RepID=A0A0B5IZS2_9VIRU|nr:hypothetical protein TW95_gp1714 [Pandoravirus inopinatum]AJF98448.1 hypothetical protein [Pandoravirus inopinatum]